MFILDDCNFFIIEINLGFFICLEIVRADCLNYGRFVRNLIFDFWGKFKLARLLFLVPRNGDGN